MSVASGEAVATRRFKRFPPGSGNLRVPLDSRGAAMAAIALWPACRPGAVWARRIARSAVAIAGARAIPGPSRPWSPPTGPDVWERLFLRWEAAVGPAGSWSVYEPPQSERGGFAVLLIDGGRPVGFAKVRSRPGPIEREWRAMSAVHRAAPASFDIPEPIGTGREAGWSWWISRPLPDGLHAPPADPPLESITAEIRGALADLPRPPGTPGHWSPMHGDLTPWNLRDSHGRVALVDWEDAGWGPPDADLVLYRAVAAALGRPCRPVPGAGEAIEFWRRKHGRPSGDARDRRLARGVGRALAWMESRA